MADRRASAVWNGDLFDGSGTVSFESSGAAGPLDVTWAARTEEAGGKTSPEELIAAAHAACFSMSLSNILARDGHTPDELRTSATATFQKTDAGFRITRMALEVVGVVPGLDEGGFEKAALRAKEDCPVSNAVTGIPNIEVTAQLG
jgi:osmotically inducible protein OsmC